MQETTNYRFKKIGLDDSPPDITATNPNWDEADRILKEHEEGIKKVSNIPTDIEGIKGRLDAVDREIPLKLNKNALEPITTGGTASAYTITVEDPNLFEYTIVPHVDNVDNATISFNGGTAIPLKEDENTINEGTLRANIPVKIVRVGNGVFIVNKRGGGITKCPELIRTEPYAITDLPPATFISTSGGRLIYNKGYLYLFSGYKLFRLDLKGENWEELAEIPINFSQGSLVVINDKIYLIGTSAAGFSKKVYIYDIATNSYIQGEDIPTSASSLTGAVAIVVEGYIHIFYNTLHWRYDPTNNTYVELAKAVYSYSFTPIVEFQNKIYSFSSTNDIVYYDVATDTYTVTGTKTINPHTYGGATKFGSYVYILGGGVDFNINYKTKVDRYNFITNTCEEVDGMVSNDGGASYTADNENIYYGCTGYNYIIAYKPKKEVWYIPQDITIYPPETYIQPISGEINRVNTPLKTSKEGEFSLIPGQIWTMQNNDKVVKTNIFVDSRLERIQHENLPYYFYLGTGILVKDDIYIFGGALDYNDDTHKFKALKYNIPTDKLTEIADSPLPCYMTSLAFVESNKIHLIGSYANVSTFGKSHWVYDIEKNIYTQLANFPEEKYGSGLGYYKGILHIYSGAPNQNNYWKYDVTNQTYTLFKSLGINGITILNNKTTCVGDVMYVTHVELNKIYKLFLRTSRQVQLGSLDASYQGERGQSCICNGNLFCIGGSYPSFIGEYHLEGLGSSKYASTGLSPDELLGCIAIGSKSRMYLFGGKGRSYDNKFIERRLRTEKMWVNGRCEYLGRVIEGNGLVNIDYLR